jgi:hypothetical protein
MREIDIGFQGLGNLFMYRKLLAVVKNDPET